MTQWGKNITVLARDEIIAALSARALVGDQRIEKTKFNNKVYWIKRYNNDEITFAKKMHGLFSKITSKDFLKSSPIVSAKDIAKREIRKYEQFSKAGIFVPNIVWANETILIIEDASPTIADLIKKAENNQNEIDELLFKFGAALADAHGLGLCHGRPHTRDTVIGNAKTGFIDFEEEPEAAMSLEMAQARDIWLAMLHICSHTNSDVTPQKIFDYWRKRVNPKTINALHEYNDFFLPILRIARKVPENYRGNDLKRGMAATSFIDKAFAELSK